MSSLAEVEALALVILSGPPGLTVVFYGKRSFSVPTPWARPTRVNTERLAERETLLYSLGFKLNRIV